MIREREQQKMDSQNKKLTRKEENDFYRAIMAYGIETKGTKKNGKNFRQIAIILIWQINLRISREK